MDNSEQLNLLLIKLENLLLRHQGFEAEIEALKQEVKVLQSPGVAPIPPIKAQQPILVSPPRNTPPSSALQNNANGSYHSTVGLVFI
ncbi:hypothetical protein [Pedobacter paludis]|uniref:hypothetical protein n=1 Tax=Pedobacter paludis TaxID=2203212 RepID=UPI00197E8B8E|nr:hypothetical protein [Pedobacter paludis]